MAREPDAISELRLDLGERLATLRKSAGRSQTDVAAAVFRDRTTVAHIERGRARGDMKFWRLVDDHLAAGGRLLAAYEALQAAIRHHETHVRDLQLAALQDRVASWDSSPSLEGHASPSSENHHHGHLIDLLGPAQILLMLGRCNRSLIDRYEAEGPERLAPELRQLRTLARHVGPRTTSAAEREALVAVAAEQAALLAYMCVNLSEFADAERHALEASWLATESHNLPLLAWIRGTQSFQAYYQQRYQEALDVAHAGLRLPSTDQQRVRLLSNGVARAAGKLGEQSLVDRAIGEGLGLASPPAESKTMTACIDFRSYGWARTVANAATAYLSLRHYSKVMVLTDQLKVVIAESDSDWSRSLVKLDEATALALGHDADLSEAASIGMQALAASARKPIASVRARAAELSRSLAQHGQHPASRDFISAARELSTFAVPDSA